VCLSWQEDEVVLQCIANIHKEQRKFCLAAEGLGNRLCFLEPTSDAKVRSMICLEPSSLVSHVVIQGKGLQEKNILFVNNGKQIRLKTKLCPRPGNTEMGSYC
jgi:hypothetical protein